MIRLMIIILAVLSTTSLPAVANVGSIFQHVEELENNQVSSEVSLFLLITALSFLPVVVIALTAFTRIIVVLSMLRFAFGMQQTPPNSVLIVLALFFTLFVMQPTLNQVDKVAIKPYLAQTISLEQAIEEGSNAFKMFMIKQTREKDLQLMINISQSQQPKSTADISMIHLVPAFMLSELRTAFQIAFVLFIPFLMIDLIVAGSLMSLGMIMVPPMTIAMPMKILVFVLVDGWSLVSQSLLSSFNTV